MKYILLFKVKKRKYPTKTGPDAKGFWEIIKSFLSDTQRSFPGISLAYLHMCPECLIQLKDKMKALPLAITDDSIQIERFQMEKSTRQCSSGHSIALSSISVGYESRPEFVREKRDLNEAKKIQIRGN